MVFLPTIGFGYNVLKWTPQNFFCKTKAGGKTLVEKKEPLSTGGFVKRIIFGKEFVFQK
jgi:hypothetical protein